MTSSETVRLDTLLVERGLFPSKARASAAVLAGDVIDQQGRRELKPGQQVRQDFQVTVKQRSQYVSRGGEKIAAAFATFRVNPDGWQCIDVGASTGGFTDYLLQHGAKHVIALDVGYGQLAWRLRQDQRVTVFERVNIRSTQKENLPYRPSCAVIDVSFISIVKILAHTISLLEPHSFNCFCLIKPQFELPREDVGKGGVVREFALRQKAMRSVAKRAQELGLAICGFASSELPGPKGNKETFIWLAEHGRSGSLSQNEVETAIANVDR